MAGYILSVIIGYLIGSVSISILLSRLLLKDDVRTHGSGNAGATNVARVYGMKAGLITLGGDMVKTLLSGLIGWLLGGEAGLVLGFAGCIIGHCWPAFFGFHGGKGVAVTTAIYPVVDWRVFLILVALFFLMYFISHRVSLCSILCAIAGAVCYWLLNPGFSLRLLLCIFVCVLLIFQHRGNIGRLIHGEEPKFQPKSSKNGK